MDKTQKTILTVVGVALALGLGLVVALGGSSSNETNSTGTGAITGLQETAAPWKPEYANLASRIQAMKIPAPGKETYHIHAMLAMYVDGQPVPIPTNIGIDQSKGLFSAVHTHDESGIIHVEADAPFTVPLQNVFNVWGVKFTADQLGSYRNDGTKTVQIYVNGQKVTDPGYVLKSHDKVVVGYGAADSFPTTIPTEFPQGL